MAKDSKKIGVFEYYTKSKIAVKADIRMRTKYGRPTRGFLMEIPEYSISLQNDDVDKMQREAEQILEEKTSIVWKYYLHIELEGKTSADLPHYHPMVKINLAVKPFKQGTNYKGVVYNNLRGSGLQEGDILEKCGFFEETSNKKKGETWNFSPDDSFSDIFFFGCDKMRAVVEDTEENRKAIEKIIFDFEAVLQRLYFMFKQENIHKTLAGNLNFLAAPAPSKLLTPKPEDCETCFGTGDISEANEPLKPCPDCTEEIV